MAYYRSNHGTFEVFEWCHDTDEMGKGWYWASGQSGCLWDSEPYGPFDSEKEAIEDAMAGDESSAVRIG